MLINSVRADEINEEIAAALMMANDTNHPSALEYVDDEYDIPEGITPAEGETFDSIIETWTLDPAKEEPLGLRDGDQYYKGDIITAKGIIYEVSADAVISSADQLVALSEQIDSEFTVIWGVGVINKGTDTEKVNRLVYPDGSWISLINFGGGSGLG